jgi:hypothetical protein
MRKISISFDLREDRSYDSFFLRLRYLGAEERLPTEWILITSLRVDEIVDDLQQYIDFADRLLVAQVTRCHFEISSTTTNLEEARPDRLERC